MKHCKTGRQFGRVRSQRKALMNSLLSSLVIYDRIETTEAKAKETKSAIDKIITKAKRSDEKVEIFRKLQNELSEKALKKLIGEMDKFANRDSGYARVIKLSPRKSDSARMAIVELVDLVDTTATKKTTKAVNSKKKADKVEDKKVEEKKAKKDDKKVVDEKSAK